MVNPAFTRLGIAVAYGADGTLFVTLDFLPLAAPTAKAASAVSVAPPTHTAVVARPQTAAAAPPAKVASAVAVAVAKVVPAVAPVAASSAKSAPVAAPFVIPVPSVSVLAPPVATTVPAATRVLSAASTRLRPHQTEGCSSPPSYLPLPSSER
jgi:hypothetical protein